MVYFICLHPEHKMEGNYFNLNFPLEIILQIGKDHDTLCIYIASIILVYMAAVQWSHPHGTWGFSQETILTAPNEAKSDKTVKHIKEKKWSYPPVIIFYNYCVCTP